MPRTTLDDRRRKLRIRKQEFAALRRQMQKLDTISDAQIATLRKLESAMEAGKLLSTQDIPDWRDLRAMGTLREKDGMLILTTVGAEVIEAESEA
jgi:hypothetical protein